MESNEAYRKYMREYMQKYRKTPRGKELTKQANQRYWKRKAKELDTN